MTSDTNPSSGQAPVTPKPSASPPAGSSPLGSDTPSADPGTLAEQNILLRDKVREMGEESKRLRTVNDQALQALRDPNIKNYLASGEFPKEGSEDNGESTLVAKAKEVFEKGDADTFANFIQDTFDQAREAASSDMAKQVGKHLGRQNERAMHSAAKEFFREKDLQHYAVSNSEFFKFVEMDVARHPWVRQLWDGGDYDDALKVSWDRFTQQFGDPGVERKKAEERKARLDASLEDSQGLPPDVVRGVEPGGDRSLHELWKELEKAGG